MTQLERKLLDISSNTIDELMKNSTVHTQREMISNLQVRTMTLEELYKETVKLLKDLKGYPNIVVLEEYVKRMGYFVGDSHAS